MCILWTISHTKLVTKNVSFCSPCLSLYILYILYKYVISNPIKIFLSWYFGKILDFAVFIVKFEIMLKCFNFHNGWSQSLCVTCWVWRVVTNLSRSRVRALGSRCQKKWMTFFFRRLNYELSFWRIGPIRSKGKQWMKNITEYAWTSYLWYVITDHEFHWRKRICQSAVVVSVCRDIIDKVDLDDSKKRESNGVELSRQSSHTTTTPHINLGVSQLPWTVSVS